MRTSLGRAASSYTPEQIRERADAIGRDAWRAAGLLVVQIDDPRLAWPDRELLQQVADKLGFGRRSPDQRLTETK